MADELVVRVIDFISTVNLTKSEKEIMHSLRDRLKNKVHNYLGTC